MKKPSFNDVATIGGFLVTMGTIVFAAGVLRSDVTNLKETESKDHRETLETLKEHEGKIDSLTSSVARIQGSLEHTIKTRSSNGTNGNNGQ